MLWAKAEGWTSCILLKENRALVKESMREGRKGRGRQCIPKGLGIQSALRCKWWHHLLNEEFQEGSEVGVQGKIDFEPI